MTIDRRQFIYRIAFASIRGMGYELAQRLLDVVESEEQFFSMSEKELRSLTGGKSKIYDSAYRREKLEAARREADFIEQNHIRTFYFSDDNYPTRLTQNMSDAPAMLYAVGNCNLDAKHVVAMVGTRRCTTYGAHFCDTFVRDLAQMLPDVVIVSGLAYGIDIHAHRAALKHNALTVGVQALGLNKVYPANHRRDAAAIVKQGGMIVTDYMSQDELHKGNFVARNRIIAGLSDCTVVVESADKGGALITANLAQSYGRDVFALPGRIADDFSKGCNRLIQNNQAMLITCAEDLVKAMRWTDDARIGGKAVELELFPEMNEQERQIVDAIRENGDLHINELADVLGIPIYRLLGALVELDRRGIVLTMPGCRYSLA